MGSSYEVLVRGIARCHIALDRKILANLAIWEPRTFKVSRYWIVETLEEINMIIFLFFKKKSVSDTDCT